ncbi:MAG: hypothetical protein HDT13_02725 [Butyrivibrio sp.]|nr:hypothetical protein [Butyrivibrio sp.]
MKKIKNRSALALAAVLVLAAVFSAGCGKKQDTLPSDSQSGQESSGKTEEGGVSYADSLEVMKLIWDEIDEEDKFPSYGGSDLENPVMNAPGGFDVSDTDALTATLIVPKSLHDSIDDAASLINMMNANNFTGAAIRVKGTEPSAAAEEIKKSVTGNQFMCGFPEKIVVITAGDYVIYAFGLENTVNGFKEAAQKKLEGAKIVCEQRME